MSGECVSNVVAAVGLSLSRLLLLVGVSYVALLPVAGRAVD